MLITLLIVQSEGILEDRIYAFLGVTFKDNLGPSFKGSILNDHMRVHHNNHASGVSCNGSNCSGDVAVAASEFTLIQPWGGGVQHGL